jgi:hypothetical protein
MSWGDDVRDRDPAASVAYSMTILDAMHDPALFGPWFTGESWDAWGTFLAGLFGLPLATVADAERYVQHTGRSVYAVGQLVREAWVIVGRRGGKSRIAALVAVWCACFRDYRAVLAPGERAIVMVLAADRQQARVCFRYVRALLEVPLLRQLVANETRDSIELTNGVNIEIHTSNFKSVRGRSCAAVIADEVAYWPSDEGGASPDVETLQALRPAMATIPGALLLAISSPYARRGALWTAYAKYWGKDGAPALVWQGNTQSMNASVDPTIISEAYEQDDAAASAEYGAEFRRDVESYVAREVVDAVIVPGRKELPPSLGLTYRAHVDPSGGSVDSFTLAVAHDEGDRGVLDLVREVRPPFSPATVVREFVDVLRAYRVSSVTGDRYAGEWPREGFRALGINYQISDRNTSELYRDFLPRLTSGSVELLDVPRLTSQLCGLERHVGRGGKDSISHPPRGHDDVVNVAAGVLVQQRSEGGGYSVSPLLM